MIFDSGDSDDVIVLLGYQYLASIDAVGFLPGCVQFCWVLEWTWYSAAEPDVFAWKEGGVADLDDSGNVGSPCRSDTNSGLVQSSSSRM